MGNAGKKSETRRGTGGVRKESALGFDQGEGGKEGVGGGGEERSSNDAH